MWGAEPFTDVLLRQPANAFLEIGITPGAATSGDARCECDEQRPQEEMETGVADGKHRTRHTQAYATLDERQVQLSRSLPWQHHQDDAGRVGHWIYR